MFRTQLPPVLSVCALLVSPAAVGATYEFSSPPYGPAPVGYMNFSPPCTHGSYCGNYDATMRVTGNFTTAAPLAPNLVNAEIYSQVVSYRFEDGITLYEPSYAGNRVQRFRVSTNAAGQITGSDIIIMQWQNGVSPHAINSRFNVISVVAAPLAVGGLLINANCDAVGPGPLVVDDCVSATSDDDTSFASAPSGTWTVRAESVPVPTLSEWATISLSGLLALAALGMRRKGA